MAIFKEGVSDSSNFFNLNGLDYQKGIWEVYYDSKAKSTNIHFLCFRLITKGI
jgi:hypothetical protein